MSHQVGSITKEQQEQFAEEGYFVLPEVIPPDHLDLLRDVCDQLVVETDQLIDRGEWEELSGITHKGQRYFIEGAFAQKPELGRFLFSNTMAEICRSALGPTAYLFKNQFVVKCAKVGMNFSWHQDSAYVPEPHLPYLGCWCALDAVNEQNGTVYLLPWSRSGGPKFQEHFREEGSNDLVGYTGDDPGVPVIMEAGGIAVFSSATFHRSGANTTGAVRRVYLAGYSPEVMPMREGAARQAVPFLKNGVSIANRTS